MAHAWTYDTAASFWTRSRQNPEGVWDTSVSAELSLLEHRPRTPAEAAQILAVLVTIVWCGVFSAILYKVVDMVIGLRPTLDAERQGLDLTSHGEVAYHS